jgi:hypothetical protein
MQALMRSSLAQKVLGSIHCSSSLLQQAVLHAQTLNVAAMQRMARISQVRALTAPGGQGSVCAG